MPSAVAVAPGQRDNTAAASVLARAAALAAVVAVALMADRTLILEVGVAAADTAVAPEASSEQTMVVAVPEVQAVDPTEGLVTRAIRQPPVAVQAALPTTGNLPPWALT